jgi:atypical dual specificity phosphatase
VGVTTLINLTETPSDPAPLERHGLRSLWEPIPDMLAPELEQAMNLCRRIDDLMAAGEVVAVHCYAGLGRTGTVLASTLIWEGMDALSALETVRRIEPRWVQSQAQVDFLGEFARALAAPSGRTQPEAAQAVAA